MQNMSKYVNIKNVTPRKETGCDEQTRNRLVQEYIQTGKLVDIPNNMDKQNINQFIKEVLKQTS